MCHIRILLAAALPPLTIALSADTAHAGDLRAGRAKAEAACQTCHGVDGLATVAMVPNLSGQRKDYLIIQLQAFRAGRREHAQMSIIAKSLSDADIENVAEWYSSIRISVELPD